MTKEELISLYKSGEITAEEYASASIWASDSVSMYFLLILTCGVVLSIFIKWFKYRESK